jgi:alpha-beta hydrolase superfamily lysophospholipase
MIQNMTLPFKNTHRTFKITILLVLLLLVAYLAISGYIAGRILHPVRKPLTTDPSRYGLHYEAADFTSTSDGLLLKGWFMDAPHTPGQSARGTIVLLHGHDSTKDNYIMMELARALIQHGYNVFSFDFRGHGESAGEIGSLGEFERRDVAGALAYLRTRGINVVGVVGYSMGAATALLAAQDHPEMRAIVSDSSFARLITIVEQEGARANTLAPFFNPGVILMGRLLYGIDLLQNEPKSAVASLGDRPLLLIHSTGDNLILPSAAYELQAAGSVNPNLQLWVAEGKGHVSAFADNRDEYIKRVIQFFDKWLGSGE